jgi:hypothetical protein
MRSLGKLTVCFAVCLVAPAFGATITGNVKGPDGKPFMGAFVVADNTQNKMTVSVLSDAQGRYHMDRLPAATYSVAITAIGYTADPRNGVQLADSQNAAFDFALQNGTVRWSDLNTYQGTQLLPKGSNHDLARRYQDPFFTGCMISCHSFQHRMASTTRNEDGWRSAVNICATW